MPSHLRGNNEHVVIKRSRANKPLPNLPCLADLVQYISLPLLSMRYPDISDNYKEHRQWWTAYYLVMCPCHSLLLNCKLKPPSHAVICIRNWLFGSVTTSMHFRTDEIPVHKGHIWNSHGTHGVQKSLILRQNLKIEGNLIYLTSIFLNKRPRGRSPLYLVPDYKAIIFVCGSSKLLTVWQYYRSCKIKSFNGGAFTFNFIIWLTITFMLPNDVT